MKLRNLLLPALIILPLTLSQKLPGQGILPTAGQAQASEVASDTVPLQPFPAVGITREFGATSRLISASGNNHLTEDMVASISSEVDTLIAEVDGFMDDSTTLSLETLSSRELDQVSSRSQLYMNRIAALQDRYLKDNAAIAGSMEELQVNRQRYRLTGESGYEDPALEAVMDRIQINIFELDSAIQSLQGDQVFLLGVQETLTDKKLALQELVNRVKHQKVVLGQKLLNRDVPGFFKDLSSLGDSKLLESHWQGFKGTFSADAERLKKNFMRPVVTAIVALMALLAFLVWFKRNRGNLISGEHAELSKTYLTLVNSPGASGIFITTLLVRLLIPDLPQSFFSMNLFILMLAMATLVIRIYGSRFSKWIVVLVFATSVNILYELAYHPGVLLRILLLGLCFVGIWVFTWLYRKKPFDGLIQHKLVNKSFKVLIVVFLVLQFLAIIANLVGIFHLAEYLALIPFQITILLIAIHVATCMADTILYMALSSNYLRKLNVVRDEFQVIYRKGKWLTDFIFLLLFISLSLGILRIKDLVFDWGRGVMSDGIKIGAIDITLGSIMIFFFVIWLSIIISRIISNVLEKDVFARVKTAKGIPGTIILILKIVLISGGFFLAAAASGMHLTNLSIVLGAFSVGIGFGLQNIFNNLVSGLILAFERPINVGDVVQVGELMGEVRIIGLRSSTVRTFDGAEVIVPNGNLISNEMINWTLTDSNRRMDIQVGVKYGTTPELVLNIMLDIARAHKNVGKDPEPRAYFIDFGDSSLNFRLLAWVALENRLETESDIRVQINQKLAEAGIEIPFPQRDLHIRSDHTRAEAVAKPGPEVSDQQAGKPRATRKRRPPSGQHQSEDA